MKVRTTCPYCGVGCGVLARVVKGVADVSGDPKHPANRGALCSKGSALGDTVGLEGRLLRPRVRDEMSSGMSLWMRSHRDSRVHRAARSRLGGVLRVGPVVDRRLLCGQQADEGVYRLGNIDTNSRCACLRRWPLIKGPSVKDLVPTTYEDLELADLIVLVGSNLAWCHPVLYQRIRNARSCALRCVSSPSIHGALPPAKLPICICRCAPARRHAVQWLAELAGPARNRRSSIRRSTHARLRAGAAGGREHGRRRSGR